MLKQTRIAVAVPAAPSSDGPIRRDTQPRGNLFASVGFHPVIEPASIVDDFAHR